MGRYKFLSQIILPLKLKSALIYSFFHSQSHYSVTALYHWCIHSFDFIMVDLIRLLPSLGCPSGLGCCSKTSDASESPVWGGCLRSFLILPWWQSWAVMLVTLNLRKEWLARPPSLRRKHLSYFLFTQAQPLLPFLPPEHLCSPHSHSQGLPRQPPPHTCKSRSHGIRFILGLWAGEEGRSPVHTLPLPPPLSCLPCRWLSVKDSLCCFPGVETWSANGACGVGGGLNGSQFLGMVGK